ncbi:MAG: hypothetical protein R2747_01590 [Pyrinomonadaceae bacterium]
MKTSNPKPGLKSTGSNGNNTGEAPGLSNALGFGIGIAVLADDKVRFTENKIKRVFRDLSVRAIGENSAAERLKKENG